MDATTTYERRRGEIQTYFDRTAAEAWKRFATDAPLGRIRASVREGRARMRAAMLSGLPADLSGWRILDAGCGTGAMSLELARRARTSSASIFRPNSSISPQEPCRRTSGPAGSPFAPATCWSPASARSTPSSRWTR